MKKIQHYVQGQWTEGKEEGVPVLDAITGEAFTSVAIEGLDIPEILQYGRTKGGEILRKMTFQERGLMLKALALFLLKKKKSYYALSWATGATKVDSWIDIEGGIGNLFANASLRRQFPDLPYYIDGESIPLSKEGSFIGHHIQVPKRARFGT